MIIECIDDPDISIRLQALELSIGMVNSDNLVNIVERLMQQLTSAPVWSLTADDVRSNGYGVEPAADSDGENLESAQKPTADERPGISALPTEYRASIIRRIIEICSDKTYANIVEFEWYVEILMDLIKLTPALNPSDGEMNGDTVSDFHSSENPGDIDVASTIGWELRNVAVRVSSVRANVVAAAYTFMATFVSNSQNSPTDLGSEKALAFTAWIVGEYYDTFGPSNATLEPLIHPRVQTLSSVVVSAYVQAIPKVLASLILRRSNWNSDCQTMTSLLVSRIVHFLEPLTIHPSIEVQERSVEILELMRVLLQAITKHALDSVSPPPLVTEALPHLFSGSDLNPVAPTAQRKVPLPMELDLEAPINTNLASILQGAEKDFLSDTSHTEFDLLYNDRPISRDPKIPAFDTVPIPDPGSSSYQQGEAISTVSDTSIRKDIQRQERNKDDPFYIGNDDPSSGASTPFYDFVKSTNDEDVDVDSIPIMNLDLGDNDVNSDSSNKILQRPKRKFSRKIHIARDETIQIEDFKENQDEDSQAVIREDFAPQRKLRKKDQRSLLQVDSSGLTTFSLRDDNSTPKFPAEEKRVIQDEDMAKALAEVERLRLKMQRASERVAAADGTPPEGALVKKKTKKRTGLRMSEEPPEEKDRSSGSRAAQIPQEAEASQAIRKKKKKTKKPT